MKQKDMDIRSENAPIIEGESEFAARIAMYRPKMNASQNKIADFLLQDEKAAADMSIYEMAESQKKQAMVPEDSLVITNPVGLAPGLVMAHMPSFLSSSPA